MNANVREAVLPEWLAPVRARMERALKLAASDASDARFLRELEKLEREFPDLFDEMDPEPLARALEDDMAEAMVSGAVERAR